jgi:hypothetical protein
VRPEKHVEVPEKFKKHTASGECRRGKLGRAVWGYGEANKRTAG